MLEDIQSFAYYISQYSYDILYGDPKGLSDLYKNLRKSLSLSSVVRSVYSRNRIVCVNNVINAWVLKQAMAGAISGSLQLGRFAYISHAYFALILPFSCLLTLIAYYIKGEPISLFEAFLFVSIFIGGIGASVIYLILSFEINEYVIIRSKLFSKAYDSLLIVLTIFVGYYIERSLSAGHGIDVIMMILYSYAVIYKLSIMYMVEFGERRLYV